MRRKPSASHWVKKLPFETYRPISELLADGRMRVTTSRSKASADTASIASEVSERR